MTTQEMLRGIASQVQLFNTIEQKEKFLFVLGALLSRLISLQKAAEIMEIEPEFFLELLDLMGIEFSYLSQPDVVIEKNW
jgi:predicted HTH domain antitoxin